MLKRVTRSFFTSLILLFSVATQAQSVNTLFHTKGDPIGGNPDGSVTIVEFFDYQCSHCSAMAPTMTTIIKNNPDVRVVYKELPFRGPMSEYAARAALAANKQGKYSVMNHALLTTDQALTPDTIMNMAKGLDINLYRLKRDMESLRVTNQLNRNLQTAQDYNVSATPAFFIGKTNAANMDQVNFVLGEMSERELQSAINKAKA